MSIYKPMGPQLSRGTVKQALRNLDAADQATVKREAKRIEVRIKRERQLRADEVAAESGKKRVHGATAKAGFGEQSAYELLAKLGMLICAAEKDLPLDLRRHSTMRALLENDE